MASNDGQRLLVLGLSFRQHHTLHMQQVLRAYERLPPNINDRAALFTGMFEVAKDLDEDETRNLGNWLKNGGEFPTPAPRAPARGIELFDLSVVSDRSEEDDWPEFQPEDFEAASEGMPDVMEEDIQNATMGDMRSQDLEAFQENESDDEEELLHEIEPNLLRGHAPPNSAKGKSAGQDIECLICAESYALIDFPPSTKITSNCHHKKDERVCVYCLQKAIESAVTEGQLHLVVCPFCPAKLSRDEVEKYTTRDVFARYEYLSLIATHNLVMCLGLNCGSGQIHESEDPMMVCQVCSFKTCAMHKLPWHDGQTCEDFDMDEKQIERLEEAEATAKLLAKEHAQVCPNCHQGVSRTEGCDHMTCRCGMEWCYVCGTSYENIKRLGEEAHAPTCRYHPRRVQKRRDQEQAAQGHLTELVHGGPVSEILERARGARNERVRAEMRPKAAEAAEKRMREMEKEMKEEKSTGKKRRLNLHPAWEEK